MLALADRADAEMTCFPSIADICQRTGMGERGVQNVLNRLEAAGFLVIKRGGGRQVRNGYLLLISAEYPAHDAPYTEGNTPHPIPIPRMENPAPHSNTPHPIPNTPHPITLNPAPDAHVTLKNPHRTQNKSLARDVLLSVLSPETADAYIDHRKAKRAVMSEHAAELIAKKLTGHPDPDAVVLESIANGWTGVFPEKIRTQNSRPKTDLDAAFAQFFTEQPQ